MLQQAAYFGFGGINFRRKSQLLITTRAVGLDARRLAGLQKETVVKRLLESNFKK